MIITRRLITLGIALIAIALPVGVAQGGAQWPVDPAVEERPPDLPPWLIASRLGRPLDDASRYDATGPAGLSDLGAVLLRDVPEAGYDRYVDSVYPDASARGVFGLVLLRVTSF